MFALSVFSMVLAWLMDKGSAFVFTFLLCLLSAAVVPCSGGRRFSFSLGAPACPASAAFGWGVSSNSGQSELAPRVEGLQAKAVPFQPSYKGRGGVVRGECSAPPPRLILFEHCLTHFISANMKWGFHSIPFPACCQLFQTRWAQEIKL